MTKYEMLKVKAREVLDKDRLNKFGKKTSTKFAKAILSPKKIRVIKRMKRKVKKVPIKRGSRNPLPRDDFNPFNQSISTGY